MQRAQHLGKIVVVRGEQSAGSILKPDATYLITGGTGSLGLLVARRLAESGAKWLVLAGRREPSAEAQQAADRMERLGATVRFVQADVSRREDVQTMLAMITEQFPPLCGMVHAAGVLDDGVLVQQDVGRFERVLAPKVLGAWNLHVLTEDRDLDFFVMFSSAASIFGSPGQANYAAANSFLDALAHFRRQADLPATSINWGPWGGAGLGADSSRGRDLWSRRGILTIDAPKGLDLLAECLEESPTQVAVLPVDWDKFLGQFPAGLPPLFEHVGRRAGSVERMPVAPDLARKIGGRLRELPDGERLPLLVDLVRRQAARVLGLQDPADLDPGVPLYEVGFDSLMAVELGNVLSQAVGRQLPASLPFDYPTVEAVAGYLLGAILDPADRQS